MMTLGDLNTIGDVTELLKGLLSDLTVTLDSPASLPASSPGGSVSAVNLYLYQVCENPNTKNQPWVTQPTGVQKYPPLAVNLYYLLTPYADDPVTAHRVLTHAMATLYASTRLTGAQLSDPLRQVVEGLTVNLRQMSLEELTRIWNSLQSPYRLSVTYEVRVVLIEALLEREPPRVELTERVHAQI